MDLLQSMEDANFRRLRQAGWLPAPIPGGRLWREPSGARLLPESEALAELDRCEPKESVP
jgi:hypothetical protein